MAKQIRQLISDNKGCFLAVEVGYKYKCFGTDVPRAAKTLGIGSWKDAQLGDMCTFPTGTIDDKIRRLVRDGHRVAVARQTERAALRQKSGHSRAGPGLLQGDVIGDEFGDDAMRRGSWRRSTLRVQWIWWPSSSGASAARPARARTKTRTRSWRRTRRRKRWSSARAER